MGAANIANFSGANCAKPFGMSSPKIRIARSIKVVEIAIPLLSKFLEKIYTASEAAVILKVLLKIRIVDIRLSLFSSNLITNSAFLLFEQARFFILILL
ncbi:hypothetical protein DSECCO2_630150 [anaerobic digester metagenome]